MLRLFEIHPTRCSCRLAIQSQSQGRCRVSRRGWQMAALPFFSPKHYQEGTTKPLVIKTISHTADTGDIRYLGSYKGRSLHGLQHWPNTMRRLREDSVFELYLGFHAGKEPSSVFDFLSHMLPPAFLFFFLRFPKVLFSAASQTWIPGSF